MRVWRGPAVAVALALLYSLILLARGTPYDVDRTAFFLPYAKVLKDAAHDRRLPLWSPALWGGYPVHAEGQGGYASPVRLVGLAAPDEVWALDLEQALLLMLAAFSGAAGARLLLAPGAAGEALAGVVWSLGGASLGVQENPAMLGGFLMLPLALGAARRERTLALSLALAFSILSGYPYGPALILATCLAVVLLLNQGGARPGRRLLKLGAALALALALSAVQWLPTAELVLHSDRWSGMTAAQKAQGLVRPADLLWLISPIFPGALRHSSSSSLLSYLGALTLGLAGLGAWRSRREGTARFLVILGGGSLALALLLSSPLGELVSRLPGMGLVRGPHRLYFLLSAAVCLLASRGLRDVPPRAAWVLVALVALDLGAYGQRRAVPVEREALRVTPRLAELVPGARVWVGGVPPVWGDEVERAEDPVQLMRESSPLDPNGALRFGLVDLGGYGPLQPARAARAWSTVDLPARGGHLRRAAASHLILRPDQSLPAEVAHRVAEGDRWALWVLDQTLPPVRAASRVTLATSFDEALEASRVASDDTMVLEGAAPGSVAHLGSARPALTSEIVRWDPGRLELELSLEAPAAVLVTDAWYPGWEATLDGQPTPILVGDALWKATVVPAGSHRLQLNYRPGWLVPAVASTLAGLLCLVFVMVRVRAAGRAVQIVDDPDPDGLGSARSFPTPPPGGPDAPPS